MKTGILKLLIAGLVGYSATTMAMKATASPSLARPPAAHHGNWTPIGAQTRRPIGWHNLCLVQSDECRAGIQRPVNVELTPEARHLLTTVTTLANRVVIPQTDDDHYHLDRKTLIDWWTYPDDGAGDCSDYMLLKRKMLIEAGWPRSAALATVVIDQHGDGHAVLTVTTDQGDFVLDNLTDKLLRWNQTGYAYVKRQSQEDENIWVAIADAGEPGAVSSTSSLPVVKVSSR
ncbi:MAG: transglutaminase-like cysteine peptidase [Hyphomicrobiales bacterium]